VRRARNVGHQPRKRIELMCEPVASALDAMSMTFRVGPILSDPVTIRMPRPAEIRGNWARVRGTSISVWKQDPIGNATGEARLADVPAEIAEGWLRLSGAMDKKAD
jgi:hypothetical protein